MSEGGSGLRTAKASMNAKDWWWGGTGVLFAIAAIVAESAIWDMQEGDAAVYWACVGFAAAVVYGAYRLSHPSRVNRLWSFIIGVAVELVLLASAGMLIFFSGDMGYSIPYLSAFLLGAIAVPGIAAHAGRWPVLWGSVPGAVVALVLLGDLYWSTLQ